MKSPEADALRLVPAEPTEAMLDAAWTATRAATSEQRMLNLLGDPKACHDLKMKTRWSAMLAAAPASPLPEGGGWQDISTFTESGQGNPVIVAVPTKEGGWIVGEAWKCVMEPDDAYRGNDGWWWAGTTPGDAYNDPIRLMNHGDAEWWMPLPAAPTGDRP